MKAISHMNFVQSAYSKVEPVSREFQSLVQKIANSMPAYFSNYSKARALVIFAVSLAAVYALYTYARSYKNNKPSELSEKPAVPSRVQIIKSTSPMSLSAAVGTKPCKTAEKIVEKSPVEARLASPTPPSSADSDSDISGDWEPILPQDLYLQVKDANTLVRAGSITPPPSPELPSEEDFGTDAVATSTPLRPGKSAYLPPLLTPVPSKSKFVEGIMETSTPASPNKKGAHLYRPLSISPPQSPLLPRSIR